MRLTENCIHQAVEITKVAISSQNGAWISKPKTVASFIETVARKLHELKLEGQAEGKRLGPMRGMYH
jgi:hypothetical protein